MLNLVHHAPILAACAPILAYVASRAGIQIDIGRVRLKIRRQRR